MIGRKVIQISTIGVQNTVNTQCDYIITALCDDGTMWEMSPAFAWQQLPQIPDIAQSAPEGL